MRETIKATLCLLAIAVLVALAQTMDYNDQQQAQAAAPSGDYLAWHNEMLATTQDNMTPEERAAYIAKWSAENPDLAPIINTKWKKSANSQKVAQK